MTTAAALRIILDYLHLPSQRDQKLAIAAADGLWRCLEKEGVLLDVAGRDALAAMEIPVGASEDTETREPAMPVTI